MKDGNENVNSYYSKTFSKALEKGAGRLFAEDSITGTTRFGCKRAGRNLRAVNTNY